MITSATPLADFLAEGERRGANPDGKCESFAWWQRPVLRRATLGDGLDRLEKEAPDRVARESAGFVLSHMQDLLHPTARARFARLAVVHFEPAIHAYLWRLLSRVNPTREEEDILCASWRSDYRSGASRFPEEEADIARERSQ